MYTFSIGAFVLGLIITATGVVFVRYSRWVADNFGHGVSSYERYQLYALITCAVGVVVMLNIHALILNWLASQIFHT